MRDPTPARGRRGTAPSRPAGVARETRRRTRRVGPSLMCRSEEHTSELQSPCNLVCRLLLEKKKKHNLKSIPGTAATTTNRNVLSSPCSQMYISAEDTCRYSVGMSVQSDAAVTTATMSPSYI